jgi:hypothetical protein
LRGSFSGASAYPSSAHSIFADVRGSIANFDMGWFDNSHFRRLAALCALI